MNTSQERQLLSLIKSISESLQGSVGASVAGAVSEVGSLVGDKNTSIRFSMLMERDKLPRTYEGNGPERPFSQMALVIDELSLKSEAPKTAKPSVTIRVLAQLEGLETKNWVPIVTQTFGKDGSYLISVPFLTTQYLIELVPDQNSEALTMLYILQPA
jgi:hypothetical protein